MRTILWSSGGLLVTLSAFAVLLLLRPAAPLFLRLDGADYVIRTASAAEFEADLARAVERAATRVERQALHLRADELQFEREATEMGVVVPRAQEGERARQGLHRVHVRVDQNWQLALYRRLVSVPEVFEMQLRRELDRNRAHQVVSQMAPLVEREPINAALRFEAHEIVRSRPGRTLGVESSVARVGVALADPGIVLVDLDVESVPPKILEEHLAPVDVTQMLSSYETSFRGKAGPRATNIRTAASYLDGALILPGEVLSFNEIVGRRIKGRGFVDAPVIVNDEMEEDVGGGVCQVATTLHAAAVFGNLEVVRRRSHSRPSGYAPLGLDATVIDGKVDLELRNPYDEPLLVHVSFPERYKVRVELLGKSPKVRVEHAYSVTGREPFSRRVWHREDALAGGYEQKQKGSPGMDVVSVLRISHPDGRVERRRYSSKYYPVPEVYWVGAEANDVALPALPEGVTSLVIDGEEVAGDSLSVSHSDSVGRPEEEVPGYEEADGSSLTGG